MTRDEAIAIALRAIEARFPGEAAGRAYNAFLRHGIWGVYVPMPMGVKGGGAPSAEIRDSDGEVLRVYRAK